MSALDMIEGMRAAGCDAETILRAVEAVERKRLDRGRERVRRHRERKAEARNECNVTPVTAVTEEKAPQTPQKESPPSPPKGGHIPPTEFKKSFDAFWQAFPDGPNRGSPKLAMSHFRRLWLDDGVDPERLIGAARAYAATRDDPKFAHAAWRWLNDGHWEAIEPAAPQSPDTRWLSYVRHFKRRGDWQGEGPPPGQPGCMVPAHILEAEGYPPEPRLKVVGGAS